MIVENLIILFFGAVLAIIGVIWILKKSVRRTKGLIALGGVVLIYGAFQSFSYVSNQEAYQVKEKVAFELLSYTKGAGVTEKINLAEIGGVKWDFICIAGGVDYSRTSGEKSVSESLKDLSFSSFRKSDLTLDNKENGLVFVSLGKKIIITVLIEDILGREASQKTRQNYGLCVPSNEAYLLRKVKQKNRRYLILKERKGGLK